MPRLFTGIEIPNDIIERLSTIRAGLQGARWIEPSDYHLTLRYAGDVSDREAQLLADELATIDFESFNLEISGLGSFGGSKPRAIWAAIKPNAALTLLQKTHERVARFIGLQANSQNYTPHITLARLRCAYLHDVIDYLSCNSGVIFGSFSVDRFVIYSSRPYNGGGPYVVEDEYPARDKLYIEDEDYDLGDLTLKI